MVVSAKFISATYSTSKRVKEWCSIVWWSLIQVILEWNCSRNSFPRSACNRSRVVLCRLVPLSTYQREFDERGRGSYILSRTLVQRATSAVALDLSVSWERTFFTAAFVSTYWYGKFLDVSGRSSPWWWGEELSSLCKCALGLSSNVTVLHTSCSYECVC